MKVFELKHVNLSVGQKNILKEINLSVEAGDWLTLVGPSGSGKSSILKLLSGLLSVSSGQILYQGRDLEHLDMPTYRREVSYCFQQPVLFGKTVYENLSFPFTIRQEAFDKHRVVAALSRVGLSEDFLDQAVADLSGGEKQRIALIRNLLFEPSVLLLDEISTGLDKATKTLVRDLIESYHRTGHTIIEVTHDQEEIAKAKHLMTVEKGALTNG